MTGLILFCFLNGFALALLVYFLGYVVPLVRLLTHWR